MIENKEKIYLEIQKMMDFYSKKYSYGKNEKYSKSKRHKIIFHIVLSRVYIRLVPHLSCKISELTEEDKSFIKMVVKQFMDDWN